MPDSLQVFNPSSGSFTITGNISSGIWGEFRNRIQDFHRKTPGYDTTYKAALKFEPKLGTAILKGITDTTKNLTVHYNSVFTAIKKDGDYWTVSTRENGKVLDIKARVVIDATETGEVVSKSGAKVTGGLNNYDLNQFKSYRTSIVAGEDFPGNEHTAVAAPGILYPPPPAYTIPAKALLLNDADNLLSAGKVLSGKKDVQYLPLQLEIGQGMGTIAAYCAFFKTTTRNLKVRIIQGELLDFKGYLLPFADVSLHDGNWRAIQQICATGLLKGVQRTTDAGPQFLFRPDSLVKTDEIKPVLSEIYTRAFLWFVKEKPGEKFTIGNLLSFISDYTLTDPQVLTASIQKAWKSQYKFNQGFDLNRQVSRREFAVLTNRYLNPFARTIDLDGNVVN